jgi:serine/threonine protein phosphatase PrpC
MWMKMNSDGGSDPVVVQTPLKDGVLLDCHGDSKIGRLRTINQDRFFITSFTLRTFPELHGHSGSADLGPLTRSTGYLFGVADGVGGAPAGERASLLVVGTLKAFIKEESSGLLRPGRSDGEVVETLSRGLRKCQAALAEEVRRHPEYWGMATTLTAAVVLWPRLYLCHMGDSRAYLLRDGVFRRLTRDQTFARSLADAGVLDSKSADRSKWKHVVWNVLGGRRSGRDPEVHPEVHIEDLRGDDVLLLCTDGLTNPLTDETIRGLLLKGGSSEELCRSLTDSAREMRGQDDSTVVVARFADADSKPE